MCQTDSDSQGSRPRQRSASTDHQPLHSATEWFLSEGYFLRYFGSLCSAQPNSHFFWTTRGKQSAEPSAPPRPPSGKKSSTGKKIKKKVKAMKEIMGEITNLMELMIRFSKDRHSQEVSDQRDLAKTKQLLQMTHQDILDLEEETYLSDEKDAEDVARDEEEEEDEED
ncbi:hypothetical protein PIB30_024093 [Stylosanthes scabra]|uniref:Uncharacterized protein n=1 Tax=Stylosanthes scabra TaxID=79078 RepID=A0ABU6U8Q4_9FABA|nr:hypothetical protein [Stylosanthes scabra]